VVSKVPKVNPELQEPRVNEDFLERLVHQALQATRAHRANQEHSVNQGLMEPQDLVAPVGNQGVQDLKGGLEIVDQLVQMVNLVMPDHPVI